MSVFFANFANNLRCKVRQDILIMQENSTKKSTIKTNILHYIDCEGITRYDFYKKTGITRGILDQNNGMSEENTARILAYFSDLSPEWLITGRGPMLKSVEKGIVQNNNGGKNNTNIANTGTFLKSGNISDKCDVAKLEEKKECELCKEKDKVIKSLERQIKLLEKIAKIDVYD